MQSFSPLPEALRRAESFERKRERERERETAGGRRRRRRWEGGAERMGWGPIVLLNKRFFLYILRRNATFSYKGLQKRMVSTFSLSAVYKNISF